MATAQRPLITRTVKLSPRQAEYRHGTALYRGFVGGRGAGKSWVGAYDLIRRSKRSRTYLVASPTGILLADTTYPTFKGIAQDLGLWGRVKMTPYPNVYLTNGAVVRFRTAEDPERMRGPNLSGAWLDEASLMHEDVFGIVIGSLRENGEQGWLGATFTPKGKQHWTYKTFVGGADTAIVHAATADNPFNPAGFQETLARQYTTAMQQQELSGLFIDPPGAMFQRAWLSRTVKAAPSSGARVRYWDNAATEGAGDFSAGVLMSRDDAGIYYVEDVRRGQWNVGQRETIKKQTAERDAARYPQQPPRIWNEQEGGSGGKESVEATIRNLAGYVVRADRPTGQLAARAEPFAAQAEAGNVRLVQAPWNDEFIDEVVAFPSGAHDDQLAAAAGAFNKLAGVPQHVIGSIGSGGRNVSAERIAGAFK